MLKTGAQYLEEMKAMRPNVYKYGELIEDITTHPATATHCAVTAKWYDMAFDDAKKDIYTAKSVLSGEIAHRWNTVMTTPEDLIGNAMMKRDGYREIGSCMGPVCAGWTIITAMWSVTYDMDQEYGTDYHERLKAFAKEVEDNAWSSVGAITDAKGSRSLKPGAQPNPDSFLHVVEQTEEGVYISGYKTQIVGAAAAQWIVAMPTQGMKEGEEAFAICCAVPRDAEGLTIVETCGTNKLACEKEGWDGIKSGTTCGYLIFDRVFVPNKYVFLNGETKYSGRGIGNFASIYRACIGACVAGQGDVMVGAALAIARMQGIKQKGIQDKLTQMVLHNETTYGMGIGAITLGKQHKSGAFYPNALIAHANKINVGILPQETKRLCCEIAGGITETGCIPAYEDFMSPIYGDKLIAALDAGMGGENRVKMARLIEWLTVGAGIPGCMHGGGSPDTGRAVIKGMTKWEDYVEYAKKLADVDIDLTEAK